MLMVLTTTVDHLTYNGGLQVNCIERNLAVHCECTNYPPFEFLRGLCDVTDCVGVLYLHFSYVSFSMCIGALDRGNKRQNTAFIHALIAGTGRLCVHGKKKNRDPY